MKKMIFILAFALPVLCFGQKDNVKLGEQKQREKGQTENDYERERARKEQQMEQRERQQEMMREMRSALSEPDSFLYMELTVMSNGKEEEVRLNVSKSLLDQIGDPVKARKLESMNSTSFRSLTDALNELDKVGFKYLDSYSVGIKEPVLKVILRMPLPEENGRRK
ncbi:hypothetical protein [Halocola ammonii]